jgi:hypothetical protein
MLNHIWEFPRRPAGAGKWQEIIDNENSLTLEHTDIRQLRDRGVLLDEFYESTFKFTFVRNPWDRLASLYKSYLDDPMLLSNLAGHRRAKGTSHRLESCYSLVSSTEGFIEFVDYLSTANIVKIGLYNRKEWSQFNPQLDWIPDDIDFIGKFENLKNDFDFVCNQIGHPPVELSHENKTEGASYQEMYDDKAKDTVYEMYSDEINRFGYEF